MMVEEVALYIECTPEGPTRKSMIRLIGRMSARELKRLAEDIECVRAVHDDKNMVSDAVLLGVVDLLDDEETQQTVLDENAKSAAEAE